MSNVSGDGRDQWGSKFGFIMAAAGSAIGIGSIWRFPYMVGQNGGGAFVLVYLCAIALIGLPLLLAETGLGRLSGKSAIGAFKDTGAGPFWVAIGGVLAIMISFVISSYYSVIAGWTVGYIFKTLFSISGTFEAFAANPFYEILLLSVYTLITVVIVLGGVSGGIERASKIMMPMLFILLLVVAIRSVTLDGAMAGVKFYLYPDFSKITGKSILDALGQACFALSVGWGIMVTYGSYLPKNSDIMSSSSWIVVMGVIVALLCGLMIFPAVFAFGKEPNEGPALVFQIMPDIFSSMPGGPIIGAIFFLLVSLAALTSSISILEVPASFFIDEKKWSRKKATWTVGIASFLAGIPSALSHGASSAFSNVQLSFPWLDTPIVGVQNIADYLFGTLAIVIVALFTCLYVSWKMPVKTILSELAKGSETFRDGSVTSNVFSFVIRFVCPVIIVGVLLGMLGVFSV